MVEVHPAGKESTFLNVQEVKNTAKTRTRIESFFIGGDYKYYYLIINFLKLFLPFASKGKINEKVDYTKDGDTKVTIVGKLNLHGVEKDKTIDGVISINGGVITLSSKFKIKFADHNIVIPALYSGIIPEDTDVKFDATMEAFKKN